MDPEISKILTEMRKLERQAKQLLYKMDRLESQWNQLKKELKGKGKEVPHQFGDVLYYFRKKK